MLRAAALLPFLRELQRFGTVGHPTASVACSLRVAARPLPELEPVSRRHLRRTQVRCDLPGRTHAVLGVFHQKTLMINRNSPLGFIYARYVRDSYYRFCNIWIPSIYHYGKFISAT